MAKLPVVSVQLIRERSVMYDAAGIDAPIAAVNAARALIGDPDREHFGVLFLNTKHKLIGGSIISIGTTSACLVGPCEVFRAALLSGAAAIVLTHNHPSGDPTPSPEDKVITEGLIKAGKLLGIRVLDHIILGHECHYGMRELGPGMDWE